MLVTGKKKAFSLIEILVSLAIFSIIITTVLVITISMVNAQKKIQAKLFLTQTAQTTIESMSRQLRFGYSYTGGEEASYNSNGTDPVIILRTEDVTLASGSSESSTTNLVNAKNSPFILFETQGGNPNSFADQNAFCVANNKLYKISSFSIQTDNSTYEAKCMSGAPMLPENITLESLVFDVYAGDAGNPINPMIRIKMRLKHEDTGVMNIQTTITQRVVTYF